LLDDEPLRDRLGREGRRLAQERFGTERFVEGLNVVSRALTGEELFDAGVA
jgi:hypothetical protein